MSEMDATLFRSLKNLLVSVMEGMEVAVDEPCLFQVNTGQLDHKGRPVLFAMVKTGKKEVSFHLMPLYCHPELVETLSPELKKKMRGKTCFHFRKLNKELSDDLEKLVQHSLHILRQKGEIR